ncbi:MAG: tetratricopeptide repeat protein [Candidatus Alcyoniella australis]|nr:tetratricopeptide repeat protein [Candidatus Alcyoniella australis]
MNKAVRFPLTVMIVVLLLVSACQKRVKPDDLDRAEGYYLLGVSSMELGDSTGALESLLMAVEINPQEPRYHDAVGLVYYSKERFDKAINHFKQALALDPNYSDSHHNLGTVYLYLGRYNEAIDEFSAALQNDLYRNRAASLNSLGWCHYKLGDYVKAEEYLQGVIKQDRRYLIAYNNLALVYIAMDRGEDAVATLLRVLELSPDYAEAHLNLGIAYTKIGRTDQAKVEFAKVIEVDPYGKLGDQAKQYLRLLRGGPDGEPGGLP